MSSKVLLVAVLTIMFMSLFAGCIVRNENFTEDFDGEYDITAGTILTVESDNGHITVDGYSGDKVVLHAIKHARGSEDDLNKIDVVVTESTGEIIIEARFEDNEPNNLGVHMEIRVPKSVHVTEVSSSNGYIELKQTVGNTTLSTSNARVNVNDVEGFVDVSTSNGRIILERTDGIFDLSTSNGGIDAEVKAIDGDTIIKTSNADITLHLSTDLNAEVAASTSNGKVTVHDNSLDDITGTDQHKSGVIGNGGPIVSISTDNGDIDLHEL